MKSVLISIKPKWCELIANGKKTIEVRKTQPRLNTPFKVYIYCTKQDVLNHGYSLDDYDKVEQTLKNELVDYNDYINEAHEYYAYEITDEDDNIVDNMTGFSISNNNKITMLKEMQKCADDKFHYLFNELIRIEKKRESCL